MSSAPVPSRHDPYAHDPDHTGMSMVHHAPVLLAALEAAGARSVVEVGAFAGDLTRVLADWAAPRGAIVQAIDPAPQEALVALAREHPALELIARPSLQALPEIQPPDAVIIDGDHNYWTVSQELRTIEQRAGGEALPLLLFHDVSWPHARRDDYFAAEQIPSAHLHPQVPRGDGIYPGDPGTRRGGMAYPHSAAREGGARNGVLTAVEDFVAARGDLRLAVVPAFFGLGAVWPVAAPWATAVARVVDPLDGDHLLAALEDNRVLHLAREHALRVALWDAQERLARQQAVLGRLLQSSAFAVAERLSRLRAAAGIAPTQAVVGKAEIRAALDDPGAPEDGRREAGPPARL